jgi:hypothetical protein
MEPLTSTGNIEGSGEMLRRAAMRVTTHREIVVVGAA